MKPGATKILLPAIAILLVLTLPTHVEALRKHLFDCIQCHDPSTTISSMTGDNVCLKCHDETPATDMAMLDGSTASAQSKFVVGDASNAMGTHPNPSTGAGQISHFWASNEDKVPAAGASRPVSYAFYGRYGISNGKVTCSRCHNPHGRDSSPLLLKMDNSADQYCLDCHRDWNLDPVGNPDALETHPLVADYNSIATANPDKFYAAPVNYNSGDVRLVGGGVSCTSCHGMHYTDSNAKTVDGMANYNTITDAVTYPEGGDGYLLRTDGPSRTGDTQYNTAQLRSNLCQACHTYAIHGKTGNVAPNSATGVDEAVGCLTCHGGHSYSAAGDPNYFVLNRQASTDAYNSVTIVYNTTTPWNDNVAGTANGYCERCHGSAETITGGLHDHKVDDQCEGCHSHDTTEYSFAMGDNATICGDCHGAPPRANTAAVPGDLLIDSGYAVGDDGTGTPYSYLDEGAPIYKDESLTAHKTHAGALNDDKAVTNYAFGAPGSRLVEACFPCHDKQGDSALHNSSNSTGSFQDVYFGSAATYGGLLTGQVYDTSGGSPANTCDNVYCHSNGGKRNEAGKTATDFVFTLSPSWDNSYNSAIVGTATECEQCHGDDTTSMGSGAKNNSPAHLVHIDATGYNLTCHTCHAQTTDASDAVPAAARDIRNGGTHVDGAVNVDFASSGSALYNALAGATYNSVTGTCNLYCHNLNGTGDPAVDWDNGDEIAGNFACDSCHAGRPGDTTTIASGSHTIHINTAKANISCDDCHGAGALADGSHLGHLDGNITVTDAAGTMTYAEVCDSCHGVEGSDPVPAWGDDTSIDCITCHTGTNTTSYTDASSNAVAAPDKSTALTSGHNYNSATPYPATGNTEANKACEDCHDTMTYAATGGHVDGLGNDDRLVTGFACQDCHTSGGSRSAEASVYVKTHDNTDPSYTGQKRADFSKLCLACHDPHGSTNIAMIYDLQSEQIAEDPAYAGGANYNSVFAGDVVMTRFNSATLGDGFDELDGGGAANVDDICATCHNMTDHNAVNVTEATWPHKEGEDCTICHQHDGDYGGWMPAGGNACNDCHGNPPTSYSKMPNNGNPGPHALHAKATTHDKDAAGHDPSDCNTCHPGASTYDYAHSNNTTELAAFIVDQGGGNYTCDASGCHASTVGDGAWNDTNLGEVSSGVFNTGDGLNCDACHYYDAAPTSAGNDNASTYNAITLSHDEHFDASKVCVECHVVENSGNPVAGGLGHIEPSTALTEGEEYADRAEALAGEATIDFTGGTTSYTFNDSPETLNTCSSPTPSGLGCHATGTPDWDEPIPNDGTGCLDCHTDTTTSTVNPTSGLHDNSIAPVTSGVAHDGAFTYNGGANNADCVTCHTTAPSSAHFDGTLDVSYNTVTMAASVGFTDGTTPTCTTGGLTGCHLEGTTWERKWDASAYNNDASRCGVCHGDYASGWVAGTIHAETGNETRGSTHNNTGSSAYPCADCHVLGASTGNYTYTDDTNDWGGTSHHGDDVLQINYNTTGFVEDNPTAGRVGCNTDTCHGVDSSHDHLKSAIYSTGNANLSLIQGDIPDVSCAGCHGGGTVGTDTNNYWPDSSNANIENTAGEHVAHIEKLSLAVYGEQYNTVLLTDNGNGTADAKQQELCSYCHDNPGGDADHGDNANLPAETNSFYTMWSKTLDDGSYSSDQHGAGGNDTCSNVACHNEKPTTANVDGWYDGSGTSCSICHSDITAEAAHNNHTGAAATFGRDITCDDCHQTDTENVAWGAPGTPPATGHLDGTFTVTGSVAFTYDGTYTDYATSTGGSCGTNACHNSGRSSAGSLVAPKTDPYAWGAVITDCDECHENNAPASFATGSHGEHLNSAVMSGMACGDCHTAGNVGTHINQLVDFTGGGANYNSASSESITDETFSTCDTNVCHNDGKNGAPPAYTWGTNSGACNICHDDTATTLATDLHDEHLNNAATFGLTPACADCHGTGADAGTHTGHIDASVTMSLTGTGYTGTPNSTDVTQSVFGTCDTTDCHQDGAGTSVPTPAWNDTPSTADDCTLCHGDSESNLTTGAHVTHIGTANAWGPYAGTGGSTDCGECHDSPNNNTSMNGYASHIDGTVQFNSATLLGATTACDACHGGATPAGTAKTNWPGATRVTCESCHGDYTDAVVGGNIAPHNAGTGASEFTQSGHGNVTDSPTYGGSACGDCHDNTAGGHMDGVSGDDKRMLSAIAGVNYNALSFCAATCHTDAGASEMKLHYTNGGSGTSFPADGSMDCLTCHNPHGQNQDVLGSALDTMIKPQIDGKDIVNLYNVAVQSNYYVDPPNNGGNNQYGICQACHDPTDSSASGGTIDNFNRTTALPGHQGGSLCTDCHTHTDDPSFQAAGGGCSGCHGGGTAGATEANYWPDQPGNDGSANNDGLHQKHMSVLADKVYSLTLTGLLDDAASDTKQKALCEHCHAAETNDSDHMGALPAEVFDAAGGGRHAKDLWGNADDTASYNGPGADTCSTVDCHANASYTPHWYTDTVKPAPVTVASHNYNAVGGPEPGSVKLGWLAPGNDGDLDTTAYSYDMRYGTDSGTAVDYISTTNFVGGVTTVDRAGKQQEQVVTGLTPGQTYYFSMKTTDAAGNTSNVSDVVGPVAATDDTVPPVFWGLDEAQVGDESGEVYISWQGAEDHSMPLAYDIWWDTADITDPYPAPNASTRGTTYRVNGLVDGQVYNFAVRARDNVGNADTNTLTTQAIPAMPPAVPKSDVNYYANIGPSLDRESGLTGSGTSASFPLDIPGSYSYSTETNVYGQTFSCYIDNGNSASQVEAELAYDSGGGFQSFGTPAVSAPVSVATRFKGLKTFKFNGLGGAVPQNGSIVLRIRVNSGALDAVNFGATDGSEGGQFAVQEQVVNDPPTTPAPSVSGSGGIVTVDWGPASTDPDPGHTVHYDVYASEDGGSSWTHVIATDVPEATTSVQWDTAAAGVGLFSANNTVQVRVDAGDTYIHSTGTTANLTIDNTVDTVAPAQVTDLTAEPRPKQGSVSLSWTAPGDDNGNFGRATEYDIRYASTDIANNADFAAANELDAEPVPDFGGTVQGMEILGLDPGATYYFALKTADEDGNWSPLSNSDSTQGGPKCGICHATPPSGIANAGNHKKHGYTINDCANCHGNDPATGAQTYGADHQDGNLVLGYKTASPTTGVLDDAGGSVTYTQGGFTIYQDTDGVGGFNETTGGAQKMDNGTCMSFNDLGIGGCHGPATPQWDFDASLSCSDCHGDAARQDDAHGMPYDATTDNGGVVPDQIKAAPPLDNHGYDGTSGIEAERKYVGKHEEHLNYSFRFSKGSNCRLCHMDNNHADGTNDIKLDLVAAGPSAHYNAGTPTTAGTCFDLSAENCHPSGSTPKWDSQQSFDCVNCHGFGGTPPSHTTDPAGSGFADDGLGNCEWCHPAGHPIGALDPTYNVLMVPNNRAVGIYYGSEGVHLRTNIGGRNMDVDGDGTVYEAEICWSCHETQTPAIDEFGADTGANNAATDNGYDFGSLDQTSWVGATWSSAVQPDFGYKTGYIQSTHTTNGTGTSAVTYNSTYLRYEEAVDPVAKIRCSNCHDVHGMDKAPGDTVTGNPYLRGTWQGNPYKEDGAPQSGTTFAGDNDYALADGVPRAQLAQTPMGGYWIDQNSGSPTSGWTLNSSAGLCTLCHQGVDSMDQYDDSLDGNDLWVNSTANNNGHANAAIGNSGTAANASNIFSNSIRNGTGVSDTGGWMGMQGATTWVNKGSEAHGLRNNDDGDGISPEINGKPQKATIDAAFAWGVSVDSSTTDVGYHNFSCSKCHNPHASRLPKLMITNCLDVRHNTWANDWTGDTNWNLWNTADWTRSTNQLQFASTAQSCHRYVDINNDGTPEEGGWNKVTPWKNKNNATNDPHGY